MSKVERLEIAQIDNPAGDVRPLLENGNLDIVKEVKVKLEVRVGESTMTVEELMALGQGSVVKLTHSTSTPVDVLLEGRVVARGNLVAADDNFGVQITELSKQV